MKSMIRPEESSAARSIGACLFGAALAIFVFAACAAKRETIVSSTRTVTVDQGKTSPRVVDTPRTDISIVDLHGEPSADPRMEKVIGTIINNGNGPVSQLSIRVDSLDGAGNVLSSVRTPPLAQTIDARGGRATFEASVPRNPAVRTYHAVAIAQ